MPLLGVVRARLDQSGGGWAAGEGFKRGGRVGCRGGRRNVGAKRKGEERGRSRRGGGWVGRVLMGGGTQRNWSVAGRLEGRAKPGEVQGRGG